MSYFLIIRWDPPHSDSTLIESETKVSTNSQNEDFGFIDEGLTGSQTFVPDVPDGNCDSSANYIIDSKKWKISLDLKDGSIDKTELKNYPKYQGSNENKLMFDSCGRNEYSQISGFVFASEIDLSLIHI